MIQENFKIITENDDLHQEQHLTYSCLHCERRLSSSYNPKQASTYHLYIVRRDSLNAEQYLLHHLKYFHNIALTPEQEAESKEKFKISEVL